MGVAAVLEAAAALNVRRRGSSAPPRRAALLRQAACLFGAAEKARADLGAGAAWLLDSDHLALVEELRAELERPIFEEAWESGRSLSWELAADRAAETLAG
jgi:hypothetical protein